MNITITNSAAGPVSANGINLNPGDFLQIPLAYPDVFTLVTATETNIYPHPQVEADYLFTIQSVNPIIATSQLTSGSMTPTGAFMTGFLLICPIYLLAVGVRWFRRVVGVSHE